MEKLDRILKQFEAGMYTELETYPRIAGITTPENIDQIIEEMPERHRDGFARWIRNCPYEHEVTVCIGAPLDSITDELLARYKRHYAGYPGPAGIDNRTVTTGH